MAQFQPQWKAAKALFVKTTKVKKPSAVVDSTLRKPAGIDKSLTALDKHYVHVAKETVTQTQLDAYEQALAAFRLARDAYVRVLDAAVAAVPKGVDQDVYKKGLAVLKTQLKAIERNATLMGKNADNVIKKVSMEANIAGNLVTSGRAKASKLEAFLAAQAARPNVTVFNDQILTLTRDLNQSIGNFEKLSKKGYQFKAMPDPALFKALMPWASGKRKLADNASPQIVRDEIQVLASILRAVKDFLKTAR